jgi:hypothetical protein
MNNKTIIKGYGTEVNFNFGARAIFKDANTIKKSMKTIVKTTQ